MSFHNGCCLADSIHESSFIQLPVCIVDVAFPQVEEPGVVGFYETVGILYPSHGGGTPKRKGYVQLAQ